MAHLTKEDARAICNVYCIPIDRDFHALNSQHVQNVIDAANARNYRQPRGANGSRARYFHAYLQRLVKES